MPSTVSTNRELAPVVRNAAYSELNRTTLRTPFRLGFCRGPRQAVIHGGFRLVPGLTLTALRRCALLARDACDRLLPSTASISSTRVSFVLRRPRGSRLRTFSASVCATCPGGVASRRTSDRAPSGFTPPWWLRCIDALAFASRSSVKAYSSLAFVIDRIGVVPVAPSLMHRLANPFALAHASPWRQGRPAAEPVKTPPLYDPTRLPSKGALLRLAPLRHPPRTPWNLVPRHASLLGSSGFAATRPRTTPLH